MVAFKPEWLVFLSTPKLLDFFLAFSETKQKRGFPRKGQTQLSSIVSRLPLFLVCSVHTAMQALADGFASMPWSCLATWFLQVTIERPLLPCVAYPAQVHQRPIPAGQGAEISKKPVKQTRCNSHEPATVPRFVQFLPDSFI